MKPIIGITTIIDREMNSYWMLPQYVEMVKIAGGVPVVLTPVEDEEAITSLISKLDGVIIAGGPDINPEIYNEEKSSVCGEIDYERDNSEIKIFMEVYKNKKPVLGICRGFQLINSLMGGSLFQDIPTQFNSEISHRQERPYSVPKHSVNVSGFLSNIVQKNEIMVNSCHHQGIKVLANNLEIVGQTKDGLIEAFTIKDYPFGLGVQWHPEMLFKDDEASVNIFKAFIDAAKKK